MPGKVYHLAPEASLLRGIPIRLKTFLEPADMCGLTSCV